jgi:hypothetical protein
MADLKISQLGSIITVVPATDVLPVVQGGTTYKITPNQILGAGGTANLASATITGDLTVRTTGLILNTSGLGVGITPTSFGAGYGTIQVSGATGAGIKMGSPTNGSYIYSDASFLNITTETNIPHRFFVNNLLQYKIEALGVFSWLDGAGGTRMTLNSFGLGIGIASSGGRLVVRDAGGNDSYIGYGATNDIYLSTGATGSHYFRKAAASAAMTLDASGRLLVGKTSGVNKIETVGAGIDGSGNVSVSTSATSIYTMKQVNTPAMCVVAGDDGSSGFCDIVLFLAANTPKVVSSQTMYGTPPARTYTASSSNLQLALASGTQNIRTAALSTLTA